MDLRERAMQIFADRERIAEETAYRERVIHEANNSVKMARLDQAVRLGNDNG